MTLKEVLTKLQSLSNDTMIALHKKNGAGNNQYGVKPGDIQNIASTIKQEHALALELCATASCMLN